ncbi:uncharacterized protein LOC130626853 [Hydractinia symbiolongicarpus]|uniref:uncharacterized protein LOC130626853 n=1 Tax=Hydractinia symbiolongicarpus TaxID=13093 RepID=UPI002550F5DA|nr:uncharacterized protein LOC130626853 [Hydractinia symbiolongicarpus]
MVNLQNSSLIFLCFVVLLGVAKAIQCPSTHPVMGIIKKNSVSHMGDGSFLVVACCPKNYHAIFFGREGVGCCTMRGQRCVFTCKCRDGSIPVKSEVPLKTSFPSVQT